MNSVNKLWKKIERQTTSLKPVYIDERLVAIVATIRHHDKPNEFWVGETTDMLDFTKVERICLY